LMKVDIVTMTDLCPLIHYDNDHHDITDIDES
jgi:hypothetical protein